MTLETCNVEQAPNSHSVLYNERIQIVMPNETTTCQRHPKVETSLRCSKCETLICPKCAVTTPVGMRCPDCAKLNKSQLFQPSVLEAIKVGLVALAAGMLGSWVFMYGLGFYTLFLSFAYGYAVGEAILRVANRKRGRKIEVIAGLAIVAGALGARIVTWGTGQCFGNLVLLMPSPLFLAAVAISVLSAISRIRYL